MTILTLQDREDFLGSNYVVKIGGFILAKANNAQIYRNLNMRYKESIFSLPFINNSIEKKEKPKNGRDTSSDTIYAGMDLRTRQAIPVTLLKCDLISHYRNNFKNEHFKLIKEEAIKRNFTLPWKDNSKIICIHLRLDDQRNHTGLTIQGTKHGDYDGRPASNYLSNLIHTDTVLNFNKTEMCKIGWDKQVMISQDKLIKLITELKSKYPDKEIHIVSYFKNDIIPLDWLKDIIKEYNITTHTNKDPDRDLWLLLNSSVLVLSKSTYSLMAGFYHQGTEVYYPIWATFTAAGLNTNYDKSGWISYV